MGVPIFNLDDFEAKFNELKNKKKLFGFFLYDSRPTHDVIERFTRERKDWLDELAGFGKIYFFFPLREGKSKGFENPSLEIARLFDIEAAKLPGIVLFTVLPPSEAQTNKVVYFHLDDKLFTEHNRIEKIFNELFQILNRCQKDHKSAEQLLEDVRTAVESLQKSEKIQPFVQYLKKGAKTLFVDLPEKMLKAMAEGFGKALGEHTVKGN